jgi:hypothetical protein
VKGMDKVMERMMKAKQMQYEKKMMLERGEPGQMQAKIGKPEPVMAFGRNTDKFKSGFGTEGSKIQRGGVVRQTQPNFGASQQIDVQQIQVQKSISP